MQLGFAGLLATSFVIGLSGALMPGPLLTVVIDRAVRRGLRAGLLLVVGHGVAEAAMALALVAGLSTVLQQKAAVALIGFAGGAFLAWMGWGIVRDAPRLAAPGGAAVEGAREVTAASSSTAGDGSASAATGRRAQSLVSTRRLLRDGILASISNPYWFLWWATVGAQYTMMGLSLGPMGPAAFYFGHLGADFLWYALVSAGVYAGRKVLPGAVYRWGLTVCGLFLIGLAGYFIYTGYLTVAVP